MAKFITTGKHKLSKKLSPKKTITKNKPKKTTKVIQIIPITTQNVSPAK